MAAPRSPKDTFITVYGRMPVLEALDDTALRVDKVIVAEDLRGEPVRAILSAARARGVRVERASAHRVKVLAGNGRHDQGVLADVVAPRMEPMDEFLARIGPGAAQVLVLDRLTNPANVGMILRSATAAGLDGVLLPRRGLPAIDPLVVKASAGVALRRIMPTFAGLVSRSSTNTRAAPEPMRARNSSTGSIRGATTSASTPWSCRPLPASTFTRCALARSTRTPRARAAERIARTGSPRRSSARMTLSTRRAVSSNASSTGMRP